MATNRLSPFLDETLASVTAQTWHSWSLIVVDDGGPDPVGLERRVTRVVPGAEVLHRPARGLPAARNAGIRAGGGALVAFLDDDDVWEPEKLTRQVAALDALPGAVGSYTAGRYVDAAGRFFGTGWTAEQVASVEFLSGRSAQPRIVTLLVRRDAWRTIGGFDESYSIGEDNEFILRLAQVGQLAAVSEPLVRYRRHGGNMSAPSSIAGRLASHRLLTEQARAAAARGDHETRRLLTQNRRSCGRASADESIRELAAALRRRDLARVGAELGWLARRAPVAGLVAVLRRVPEIRAHRRDR